MRTHFQRVVIICLGILVGQMSANEIHPDGLWNGRPIPLEALRKGVKEGDPHSFAEWAYCSRYGRPGIPYDPEAVFNYAKKAHEAGSAYGTGMLSRCYLVGLGVQQNELLGYQFAKQSADAGHPLGMKNLAHCYGAGIGPVKRNPARRRKLTVRSAELGCVIAKGNLVYGYCEGALGLPKNVDRAMKILVECLESCDAPFPASNALVYFANGMKHRALTDEVLKLALSHLWISANAGCPESMTRLGQYYSETGQSNRGVPLIMEAARQKDSYSSAVALSYALAISSQHTRKATGQFSTIYRLARDAYEAGNRSDEVLQWTAGSYITQWEGRIQPSKAMPLIEEMVRRKMSVAWGLKAEVLVHRANNPHYDLERGRAILTILSQKNQDSLHALVLSYTDEVGKDRDVVKGYASVIYALQRLHGVPLKKIKRLEKSLLKELTPPQKAEGEALAQAGFPHGKAYQDAAREILKKHGDDL